MANTATFHRMMQTLRCINHEHERFKSCMHNSDSALESFFSSSTSPRSAHQQPSSTHHLLSALSTQRDNLSSLQSSSLKSYHSTPSKTHKNNKRRTPIRSSKKSKLKKSQRIPTIKRILKPSISTQSLLTQQAQSRIVAPQKKALQSFNNKPVTTLQPGAQPKQQPKLQQPIHPPPALKPLEPLQSIADITNNQNKVEAGEESHTDMSESDNDNDTSGPLSNMITSSYASGGMIQDKLAEQQQRQRAMKSSCKPKVSALERAERARQAHERKEQQRKEKKALQSKRIQENKKRKRKEQEQQQQQQGQQQVKKRTLASKKKVRVLGNIKNNMVNGMNAANRDATKRKPNGKPELKKTVFKTVKAVEVRKDGRDGKDVCMKDYRQDSEEYQVSEYDSNFSDDDLDEDSHDKFIPEWAKKNKVKTAVKRQKPMDPDIVFGKMGHSDKTVDLEILFADYSSRMRYRQRSASGEWTKDRLTWREENQYKKNMGWAK